MIRSRSVLGFLAMAFLTVALVATANATPGVGTLEITGGYAKSSNEFGIQDNDAPGGGLSIGVGYYRGFTPMFQWGVEGAWESLGSSDYTYDDGFNVTTVSMSARVVRVSPQIRANFGSPVGPGFFAQGGLGYYNLSASVDVMGIKVSDSEGKFGWNLGAGVGIPVAPRAKLNFQGGYHSILTDNESTNYFNVRAGVGFSI